MNEPLTDEQLADYAALIDRTTPVGAVTASPGILTVLLAEVQRLGEQVARLEDDRVRLLDQQAKDDDEYAKAQARIAELEGEGHLTVADVVAWLSKKAWEYGDSNRENRAKAEAVGRMADKVSRGAIRPTEGGAR